MDQTTDTAHLTATEKYHSESDSEVEEVAQDALLGGIRCGLCTITRTARKTLATCKNEIELDDEAQKIQESSLKLIRLERSFLKTASIVSNVIDDLVSDYEDEDDDVKPYFYREEINKGKDDDSLSAAMQWDEIKGASGDGKERNPEPYIFRVSEKNIKSIGKFKERMSKEFHKRLGDYTNSLTDSDFKTDKKFVALLDQIKLGRNDAKLSMQKSQDALKTELDHDDEKSLSYQTNEAFLSSIPFSTEELLKYQYTPYNENEDMDHSVLPTVDPITKDPISFPVKNRYCNHVFDKDSIVNYVTTNPNATCPIHSCKNKRQLEVSHFVFDSILTTHVRQKNNLE